MAPASGGPHDDGLHGVQTRKRAEKPDGIVSRVVYVKDADPFRDGYADAGM
jgi:hypothetical protein